MNLFSPPPISRGDAEPPDDLDAGLRAFFHSEMPDPWPAPVTPRRAAPARRRPLLRSRFALAASVAALAAGLSLVAGAFEGRAVRPAGPVVVNPRATRLGPDGMPAVPTEETGPLKLKVNESLIQEPNGTTIKVEVTDWPTPPR